MVEGGGCQFSEQRGWILTSLRVHGKEHDMTGGVEFFSNISYIN